MLNLYAATAIAVMVATGSNAATLSVASLSPQNTYFGATSAVLPEATLTSFGDDFFFGSASNRPNSFCAISGGGCNADMEISFVGAVSNLMFDVSGWGDGDLVSLNIFGAANALLGTVTIASDMIGLNGVDLTSFGPITRLFFDDASTDAGVAYSNFSFSQTATVPLPATLPLMAGALGAFIALRRKRKVA